MLSHALNHVFQTVWLQVKENLCCSGLNNQDLVFLTVYKEKVQSCCHCLSSSTVTTRMTLTLWVFPCDLIASCLQVVWLQLEASHFCVVKTVTRIRANLAGTLCSCNQTKSVLEALEQIPTNIAMAGTRWIPQWKGGWQVSDYLASVVKGSPGKGDCCGFWTAAQQSALCMFLEES